MIVLRTGILGVVFYSFLTGTIIADVNHFLASTPSVFLLDGDLLVVNSIQLELSLCRTCVRIPTEALTSSSVPAARGVGNQERSHWAYAVAGRQSFRA